MIRFFSAWRSRRAQLEADAYSWRLHKGKINSLMLDNDKLRERANEAVEAANRLQADLDRSKSDELTLTARLEAYEREAKRLRLEKDEAYRAAGLAFKQMETYQDAVKMLVERKAISAIEVAQLNLGTFIPGVEGLPPTVEFGRVAEGKSSIDFGMKSQATEAKFRQVKGHFQQYQAAVKVMLDELNKLGRLNVVTKEDLRKLRKLRDDLSAQIRRSI